MRPKVLNVELLPIDDITPHEANERLHPDENVEILKKGLSEFNQQKPIVVDKDYKIIAGHGIWLAAKQAGYTHWNCVVSDLKGNKQKAYRIFDNKSAELSKWDDEKLSKSLYELHSDDYAVADLGFDTADYEWGDPSAPEESDNPYTDKVEAPIYEPTGEMPRISDLYDTDKLTALTTKILQADLEEELQEFLISAAHRHNVFNYKNIAEYYAHAPKEVQELMEDSALVIIDFDKAIEDGFAVMTEEIKKAYNNGS